MTLIQRLTSVATRIQIEGERTKIVVFAPNATAVFDMLDAEDIAYTDTKLGNYYHFDVRTGEVI